jgi:hypothetical protein
MRVRLCILGNSIVYSDTSQRHFDDVLIKRRMAYVTHPIDTDFCYTVTAFNFGELFEYDEDPSALIEACHGIVHTTERYSVDRGMPWYSAHH